MKLLTDRQKEVLEFLSSFIEEHSYPPTIRETAKAFSISVKGAYDHVKALEKKGFLRLGENRSRAMELVHKDRGDRAVVDLPLLGAVAAGRPVFADENWAGTVRVPADMARHGSCFALKVRGDSMKDAGIHDADLVVVREQAEAQSGDIVVALLGDETTVKRYSSPDGAQVVLKAENPAYDDIVIGSGSQRFSVLGKVIGVIRKM